MKKQFLTMVVALFTLICGAQNVPELNISDIFIDHDDNDNISLSMKVNPTAFKLKTNTQWLITPVIKSESSNDSISLKPFLLTGKNAYYYAQRQGDYPESAILRSGKGSVMAYSDQVKFLPWMNNSALSIRVKKISCCGEKPSDSVEDFVVADFNYAPVGFMPDFEYVVPTREEVKERKLSGRAYVNFIVNKTNIVPTYMNNTVELKKILNSIDSVRLNPDATVDIIRLTGYASPEGPYSNNVRLAKGRTEAVKQYVMSLYDFPASVYQANSVPEDWDGLREYIANSNLSDKDAMLNFIDNSSTPIERKNDVFRSKFPKSYAFLLKNEYPWLRHTDYYIHYVIKQYTTVEEIKEAMARDPRNLSLNEFFIVANSYDRDSNEFYDVIEKAVVYYPDVPEANLNAANAAMGRGELDRAERYLAKAGLSAEAEYSRGIFDALREDYNSAAIRFRNASNAGLSKADKALEMVNNIISSQDKIKFRK